MIRVHAGGTGGGGLAVESGVLSGESVRRGTEGVSIDGRADRGDKANLKLRGGTACKWGLSGGSLQRMEKRGSRRDFESEESPSRLNERRLVNGKIQA